MVREHMLFGRQRGSITVFFVLFVAIAAAAISYSIYVGRTVERKMTLDSTADAAALAMASNAALGLNMISANNLATAANLHVGASVPFIGRYYAIVKALLVSFPQDSVKVGKLWLPTADETDFAGAFGATRELTAHFTMTAAGITSINKKIANYWAVIGLPKGIEIARLNAPGSMSIPMQVSAARMGAELSNLYRFRYESLKVSNAKNAMCQTIKSSEGISYIERNRVSMWLGGVIGTLADTSFLEPIRVVESGIQAVGSILSSITSLVDPILGTLKILCAPIPWPKNRGCKKRISEMTEALRSVTSPPIPRFEGCGLNDGGDFGDQFEAFGKAYASETNAIGFVFPDVGPDSVERYEDSLQYAVAVASPLYLQEELPAEKSGNVITNNKCPKEWTETINGHDYCSLLLDGINLGYAARTSEVEDLDVASGGIGRAVGTNGGKTGGLRGVWSRMQWSFAQARAEYEPDSSDPQSASAININPSDRHGRANARTMQLFWPAWKARGAEPTAISTLLRFVGQ